MGEDRGDVVVDVVLVGRHPRGADLDAEFTDFVAEHAGTLRYTAWLLVGDRADSLVRQALVRTYGAWSRAHTDPLAFTRRVLVNLRDVTSRQRLTASEALLDPSVVDQAEAGERLLQALAQLRTSERRVVVLRYLVDLSDADVAADLGVAVGTVTSTATRSLAVLRAALGDDIDLPTGDASDDEWAAALREFARAAYPAGSRPDSTIVVRAGRRRKTARRAAGTSAACAVVVALAFAMPPLVDRAGILATPPGATTSPTASAPPKQTPSSTPILSPTQSPAGPQRPVTVGSTQVATAGQDIQAVNLPTAVSATRMTAADVAGFDLTIDIADGFITLRGDGSHIGLPELSTKTTWIPAGPGDRNHAGSWMTAYGTSPLPTGPVAAALVAGEVPPWFGDPHVYILSNPSFALPDGTVPAIELPTFATPTGALAFAVVLRDDAARVFDSGSHGIVIQARDGTIVTPDCGPADGGECATQIPYVAIGQALAGPIGHLADDPVQPYAAPSPSTSSTSGALPSLRPGTMPSDERPAKAAPPTVTLAEGVAAANGLSSRAGDLGAVDPNVAGTYYLAGDLAGASVRIGVTSGAAPRLTIFGVTTYGVTTSPLAASGGDPFLTFAPIDASLSQVSAYFPYVGSPGFTAGITPAGSPRVFLVASWGFALADGSRVHALEVPTFAPPAAVAGPLTRDQRMWVLTDPGMAGGWGDGWSGYVFATADGTIVDPGCGDREAGSVDACTQEDLGWFGAFDEIRAMLAR